MKKAGVDVLGEQATKDQKAIEYKILIIIGRGKKEVCQKETVGGSIEV